MNILSVSSGGFHDASAALVSDGVLVAAAEEERFTRKKHDGDAALHATGFCLRQAGLTMADIDYLAIPDTPFEVGRDSDLAGLSAASVRAMIGNGRLPRRAALFKRYMEASRRLRIPAVNLRMFYKVAATLRALRGAYGRLPAIRYYDHHRCHAAAAYFTSGLAEASVATIDGGGGAYGAATWRARGTAIDLLRGECLPNALGRFYEDCTDYLGLGAFGEGKAMGLAPYGTPASLAPLTSKLLALPDDAWYAYQAAPSPELVGFERRRDADVLRPPYPDFAAAVQQRLEQAVQRVTRSAMAEAGSSHLCLAGGVMLNCSSNGMLLRQRLADSIWIFPAAGDGGLSTGAALLCAAQQGEPGRVRLRDAYLGPEFSVAECEAALRREPRVRFKHAAGIAEETAALLADGYVVGWFQGRMEIGPRALGNRSILADPRRVEIRDRVNRIKHREAWRPLAPVVLAERAAEFFTPDCESPFMLFAMEVRPERRALVPAIVHVDGTARPQTVRRDQNARLHDLLTAFDRRTAVPVLLNTSFNNAAEPLVCTPQDALKTFLATELDFLVLGNYLVSKFAPVTH